MMTTAHSMETSVTGTNNNPSQDYTHTYNQTTIPSNNHHPAVTGTNNNPSQDYTHTYNQTTMLHERHVVFDCVCFYCILKRMFSIRFIIPLSRLFLCSKNPLFQNEARCRILSLEN